MLAAWLRRCFMTICLHTSLWDTPAYQAGTRIGRVPFVAGAEKRHMDEQDNTTDVCPGTGGQVLVEDQQGGDDWYVKCPVCGMRWAGGSHVVAPHQDWRTA